MVVSLQLKFAYPGGRLANKLSNSVNLGNFGPIQLKKRAIVLTCWSLLFHNKDSHLSKALLLRPNHNLYETDLTVLEIVALLEIKPQFSSA